MGRKPLTVEMRIGGKRKDRGVGISIRLLEIDDCHTGMAKVKMHTEKGVGNIEHGT